MPTCVNPQNQKFIYRKKNGGFKTTKFNNAVKQYNKCMAGKLSSQTDVIDELGDAATDLASAIGLGGERPAYAPPYSEGSGYASDAGDTTAYEGLMSQKVAGIPLPLIGLAAVGLALYMR
jgi:hypothetical protein